MGINYVSNLICLSLKRARACDKILARYIYRVV